MALKLQTDQRKKAGVSQHFIKKGGAPLWYSTRREECCVEPTSRIEG